MESIEPMPAHDVVKGAWRDTVFVERLRRTTKYQEVNLRAHDTVSDARGSLSRHSPSATHVDCIRAFSGRHQTGRTSTGRAFLWRPNLAEAPLKEPGKLFKQTESPLIPVR